MKFLHKITCWIKNIKIIKKYQNIKIIKNNIKNNDQKYFRWCQIRHINPVKIHSERITQKDKELVNDLNYEGIEFPVSEENLSKIEIKTTFASMVFVMKINS